MGEAVDAVDEVSCVPSLQGIFDHVRVMDPRYAVERDVVELGRATAQAAFDARRRLQSRLAAMQATGSLTPACLVAARRADLAMRYFVDHLFIALPQSDPWLTSPGFTGLGDLRAGDVLVTRGDALSSAGIAHMGRIDSQFSHNAMLHADDEGRLWTVEAYLERGALVQPLDDFLAHHLGRIVVVRYEDPALAAKGASLAYARIASGAPIDYDAKFDGSNADELFCSEVTPWALALAGGPTNVPLFPTVFPHDENPALFAAMGVAVDLIAAPADLLYDGRFDLIGEWRNVARLDALRRQDAVVESLFTWMERDGYRVDPGWRELVTVDVGLAVRRTPLIGGVLANMLHPNGDRQFLVAGLALQTAGEALDKRLERSLRGAPPMVSWDAMKAELERIRDEDYRRWQRRPKRAKLHRVFHP